MKKLEAKRLKKGDRVYFGTNKQDTGIVQEVGYTGFLTKWEDGQNGWIDFKDAEKVNREESL
jgi:hypothetical protein